MKYLLFGFVLSGCSSSYFLKPQLLAGEQPTYRSGREFRDRDVKGVSVSVALEELRGNGEALFKVAVKNGTDQKFDFAPAQIGCLTDAGAGAVADPEQRLEALRDRENSLEPSSLDTTARTLNLTNSLLTSFSRDPQTQRLHEEADEREAQYAAADEKRAEEKTRIGEEKKYWSDQALRRTTLAKGDAVSGDLVCRPPEDYANLVVRVTVPGGVADFGFTHGKRD
jgi:hypothetical protein